jgi:hypothetical protein
VRFEELPAAGDKRTGVSHLGNLPAGVLAGTVEKLVAKMDENDLTAMYRSGLAGMSADAYAAFIEAVFDAFRERGESSEDAAEGAGTTLDAIAGREGLAAEALLDYARANSGLMKETTALFVERRPDLLAALPAPLYEAIAERLTAVS